MELYNLIYTHKKYTETVDRTFRDKVYSGTLPKYHAKHRN